MTENRLADSVARALFVLAGLAGLVELVYRPFVFGPVGLLVLLIGSGMSAKYRRLSMTAAFVIAGCFVIGASIAVWDSRALY